MAKKKRKRNGMTKKQRSAAAKKGWRKRKRGGSKKRKSNGGKKRSYKRKAKGKRKRNPSRARDFIKFNEGLEGLPGALPAIGMGLLGYMVPGVIAMLFGQRGRAWLAKTFRGAANAQLVLSLGGFLGMWGLSSWMKGMRRYRKAVLMGSGLRLGIDGLNAVLPAKGWGSNVRALVGLPGGNLKLGGGESGTALKVLLHPSKDSFQTPDKKRTLLKGDVIVKDGKYFEKKTGAALVKVDGKTPWTTKEVPTLKEVSDANVSGWQYFQPMLDGAGNLAGWQYFQPDMHGNQMVMTMDARGNALSGWQYFQPQLNGAPTVGSYSGQDYTVVYDLPLGQSPSRGMIAPPGFTMAAPPGAYGSYQGMQALPAPGPGFAQMGHSGFQADHSSFTL